MKYIRFLFDGKIGYGILEDGSVKELSNSYFEDFCLTGRQFDLEEVMTLMPCMPGKVVAIGMNYADHIKELGHDFPVSPVLFVKLPHTCIGPGEAIILPPDSTRVDYEAELAVVIKKRCKNISPEQASEYILGATCLNDITERDKQKVDGQWFRAKNYETFCPFGPYIADGLNYNNLDVCMKLNGKIMQNSNTSHLIFGVEQLISFISKAMPLEAGDIVTTGTPFGVSAIHQGDVTEVIVEGVGTLKNFVI